MDNSLFGVEELVGADVIKCFSSKRRPLVHNHKCNDLSNVFMVRGATFVGEYDILYSPTTATKVPDKLIPYSGIREGSNLSDCFAHFYKDDYKSDGRDGIQVINNVD